MPISMRERAHPTRKLLFTAAIALALCLPQAGEARADGMRCGHRLISEGDSTRQVESRCGAPVATRSWTELRAVQVRVGNVWVERMVEFKYEEWTYDNGPDRLVRYVTFENDKLLAVHTGRYGEAP